MYYKFNKKYYNIILKILQKKKKLIHYSMHNYYQIYITEKIFFILNNNGNKIRILTLNKDNSS